MMFLSVMAACPKSLLGQAVQHLYEHPHIVVRQPDVQLMLELHLNIHQNIRCHMNFYKKTSDVTRTFIKIRCHRNIYNNIRCHMNIYKTSDVTGISIKKNIRCHKNIHKNQMSHEHL